MSFWQIPWKEKAVSVRWPVAAWCLRRAHKAQECLVVALIGLVLAAVSCGSDPEVEGQSKRPMAKQAVEQYLGSMSRGDFATAARYFAGPFDVLRAETRSECRDATALLKAYAELPNVYRKRFKITGVRLTQPHTFFVDVEFRHHGWPDVTCEFRVTYDGMKYLVLGLPPKTGESAMDPPVSN